MNLTSKVISATLTAIVGACGAWVGYERLSYIDSFSEATAHAALDSRYNSDGGEFTLGEKAAFVESFKPWQESERSLCEISSRVEPPRKRLENYNAERRRVEEGYSSRNRRKD